MGTQPRPTDTLRRPSDRAIAYAREAFSNPPLLDQTQLPTVLRYAQEMQRSAGEDFPRAVAAGQALNYCEDPKLDADLQALRARVKNGGLTIDRAADILLSKSDGFNAPRETLLAAYKLALQDENLNIRDAVADVVEHDAHELTAEEIGEPPAEEPMQFSRDGRPLPPRSPGGCTEREMKAALRVCTTRGLGFHEALQYVRRPR